MSANILQEACASVFKVGTSVGRNIKLLPCFAHVCNLLERISEDKDKTV